MEFLDWFETFLCRLAEALLDAIKKAYVLLVIVLTTPIWLVPFIYWRIFVKKKED